MFSGRKGGLPVWGGRGASRKWRIMLRFRVFPKRRGAGDKVHLAGVINKIGYKMGFIDKVAVFVDEFLKIGDALFKLFHDVFQHSMLWALYLRSTLGPLGLNFLFFRQKKV